MRYGSVCSGVEAATVAWRPLGWEPQWFSEIEKFPSAVLAHHYPDVPNYGDMTQFKEWPNDRSIDLLVGGTPCQSFSVAGLRKGLDDPRGNLMLTHLAIAAQYRPKWLVWENVPGVLSSNRGRDFGSFLGALGQCGYGFAYRVLDAQFYGVPQRRRRVFVVGHLGDWRRAAAVLFERESLSGHPAPSRKARQETAGTVTTRAGSGGGGGLGTDEACSGYLQPIGNVQDGSVATLSSREYKGLSCGRDGMTSAAVIAFGAAPLNTQLGLRGPNTSNSPREGLGIGNIGEPAYTLQSAHGHAVIAFPAQMSGTQAASAQNISPTLSVTHETAVAVSDPARTLSARHDSSPCYDRGPNFLAQASAVRRLTPRECERLQGFSDDYTRIPWRNKPAENCPDGPRYKAMGNSMAVPVMRWIGERIKMVDAL